ncbi:MAG: hypothetical protein Q8M66_02495 [Actinomycetota bacterium]|nr:hypothetical protein [Actinomycetota bacterium]MDZ4179656.1 hypothetical protein [Coriobacteriia bacterium]
MRLRHRRTARMLLVGLVAGFVLGAAIPAFAGIAYSSYGYYTVYGIGYRNRASVYTYSDRGFAATDVFTYPAQNVPSGYMGALARLYNSSGTLVRQSTWRYNSGSASGLGATTSDSYTIPTGVYYSLGQSRAWNGSGYTTYNTFRSPNQNFPG